MSQVRQTVSIVGFRRLDISTGFVQCRTNEGVCTVELPSIESSQIFYQDYIVAVSDSGNNAANNAIAICAPNNGKINGQAALFINTNGATVTLVPIGANQWTAFPAGDGSGGVEEWNSQIFNYTDFQPNGSATGTLPITGSTIPVADVKVEMLPIVTLPFIYGGGIAGTIIQVTDVDGNMPPIFNANDNIAQTIFTNANATDTLQVTLTVSGFPPVVIDALVGGRFILYWRIEEITV